MLIMRRHAFRSHRTAIEGFKFSKTAPKSQHAKRDAC